MRKYMIFIILAMSLLNFYFSTGTIALSVDYYIITEKYQKQDGTPIDINTITQIPRSESYIKNAPQITNYVAIDAKVDGKPVGNKDIYITIESSITEHEAIFIYKDDKNNNGIPDDEENFIITEKYQKQDGTSIRSDTSVNLDFGGNYSKTAPDVKNYISVNASVDGTQTGSKTVNLSNVSKSYEVVFIYKDDKNNNGVPDDEENIIITEKYQKTDGSLVKDDANVYINLGETYTKVAPIIKNYVAVDINLNGNLLGKKDIILSNVSQGNTVIFLYKDDKNNNGIPDDEESYTISEKYQKTDGSSIQDDTIVYVKAGDNYTKTSPVIKNYMAVDIKLDGASLGKKDIAISKMDKDHEVIFIYEEESFTITEKYQKQDGTTIKETSSTNIKYGQDYENKAPKITNYVIYNIRLDGNLLGSTTATISDVNENHELIFIYKDDKNNNNVADDDEHFIISEKYQKSNGVSLKLDTSTTVSGNQSYTKAAPNIENYVLTDVKVDGKSIGKTSATINNIFGGHSVIFIYEDDKNKNGIEDSKESYTITEKYKNMDGTTLKDDLKISYKGAENYSRQAPIISGYDLSNIIIDGVLVNSGTATINNLDKDHEVVFTYNQVLVVKPSIDPITPLDNIVSGMGVSGNKIELTFKTGSKKSTKVDKNGVWKLDVPKEVILIPEDEVTAQAYDDNGDMSDKSIQKVLPYPLKPKILEPIRPTDKKINGQGEQSKNIVVTFSNGRTDKKTIGATGNWEVDVPIGLALSPGDKIKAYVEDKNGNKSPEVYSEVIDISKPSPAINPITPGDKVLRGTGTAGNTINIALPGETEVKSAVIDASGNFSININIRLEPGDIVKVVEINKYGITSDTVISTVLDLPMAPVIQSIKPNSDVINGEGDAGDQIVVTFPNGRESTGYVGTDGKWTINVPAGIILKSGDLIKAYAVDKNSNKSSIASIKVAKGQIPVLEVVSNKVLDINSSIILKSLINSARDFEDGQNLIDRVIISGTVDTSKAGGYIVNYSITDSDGNETTAKSYVSVKSKNTVMMGDIAIDAEPFNILSKYVPILTESDVLNYSKTVAWNVNTCNNLISRITIDKSELKSIEGVYPIYLAVNPLKAAKGKDSSGNDAAVINIQVFELEPPIVDLPVRSSHMYISGNAEQATKVVVTFANGIKSEGVVYDSGQWYVLVPNNVKLNAKDKVKVYSQNEKGSKSEEITVKVIDPKVPTAQVNAVSSGDKDITGKGEASDKIQITFQDGIVASGIVNNDGTWSVPVPDGVPLKQGNIINVVEKDKNLVDGNEVIVEVGKCYTNLKITRPVKAGDKIVRGIGTPGNKVVITFRNGNITSSVISGSGLWTVNIPPNITLIANDRLIAQEEDAKGNSSNSDIAIISSAFTQLPGEV
ncbi:MAG: Ig-like domain-containing protein [Oscillospiraceae bacterium]|nr:Ig-like domain-containing protein [Oscillospiraceae bacterium]